MDAFHVQYARHLTLIEQRDTYLRGNPFDSSQEGRITVHIFDQHRLLAPYHPTTDPIGEWNTFDHMVIAYLVLQHQNLTVDKIKADLGITESLRNAFHNRSENEWKLEFASERLPDPIQ